MNIRLFLGLAKFSTFWSLRNKILHLSFQFKLARNRINNYLSNAKLYISLSKELLSIVKTSLISSLIFAAFFQFIVEPYLYPYYKFGWNLAEKSDYIAFMATISGIGGIFIGLYYASISTVASTAYSKFPDEVKQIFIRDPIGNAYISFLTFLTLLGIIFIALHIMGFGEAYSATPFIVLFSSISIGSFFMLGKRVLNFSDPLQLSNIVYKKLHKILESVAVGGFQSNNENFQIFYYKKASNNLNEIKRISNLVLNEEYLNGNSSSRFCNDLIIFLCNYNDIKLNIFSNSYWWERRHEYKDWYKADSFHLNISLNNQIPLLPAGEISDKQWVEKRCLLILENLIMINIKQKSYAEVISNFELLASYIERVIKTESIEEAFNIIDVLIKKTFYLLLENQDEENHYLNQVNLDKLAVIDSLFVLLPKIAIAQKNVLDSISRGVIKENINSINWNNNESIYTQEFRSQALERIEILKNQIAIEYKIKEKIITPEWYRAEIVMEAEAERLVADAQILVSSVGNFFFECIECALHKKENLIAAHIMSRQLEYWHKLKFCPWLDIWNDLSNKKNLTKDILEWPDFSMENLNNTIKEFENKYCLQISQILVPFRDMEHKNTYQDYEGQFLHYLEYKQIKLLLENNYELFEQIFSIYFNSCVKKATKLFPSSRNFEDLRTQRKIKIAMEPLLHLMQISGYTKLLSEYHNDDRNWNIVKNMWDATFTDSDNRTDWLNLIRYTISIYYGAFSGSRYLQIYANWKNMIVNELQEKVKPDTFSSKKNPLPREVNQHESAIVRIFCKDIIDNPYQGSEIFFHLYFKDDPDMNHILDSIPDIYNLTHALEFENEEYQEYLDSKEER